MANEPLTSRENEKLKCHRGTAGDRGVKPLWAGVSGLRERRLLPEEDAILDSDDDDDDIDPFTPGDLWFRTT